MPKDMLMANVEIITDGGRRPRPGTAYKLREWKISPDLD